MLQLTLFETKSSWTTPATLPNLTGVKRIAVDTEVKDPFLTEKGPGFHRKDGYPVGVSLSAKINGETKKWYLPFAHLGGGNLDKGIVVRYLNDLFKEKREWVFANASYDLGWLRFLGLKPNGIIRCIQITEALLDEEREDGYSLNSLCKSYLNKKKSETLLKQAAQNFGIHEKKELWKLPSKYVGLYAEDDAADTLAIFEKQLPLIKEQELDQVFDIESRLITVFHEANFRGIRIDTNRADRINEQWKKNIRTLSREFEQNGVDIWAPESLGRFCDKNNIEYPRTEKSKAPSFTKEFLEQVSNPFLQRVRIMRQLDRIRSVYLEKNLLTDAISGRIHPEFIQLHGENGGARSGRLACRNPNAQQIPKRSSIKCDPKTFSLLNYSNDAVGIGTTVRSTLIPEEGRKWVKLDYDSQEPRMQVHYALMKEMPGAKEALEVFNQGRKLYHMIEESSTLTYAQSKDTWLGRSYGMGVDTFIAGKDYDYEEGKALLEQLDLACPFIKLLQDSVSNKLEKTGYIKTLLGGRQRFDHWEPELQWEDRKKLKKLGMIPKAIRGEKEANKRWAKKEIRLKSGEIIKFDKLQRAFTYKGLNRLIQGGSAYQAKKGYLDAWDAGYLVVLPLHDEGNWADIENEKQAKEIKTLMENAVQLALPTKCDLDFVERWL